MKARQHFEREALTERTIKANACKHVQLAASTKCKSNQNVCERFRMPPYIMVKILWSDLHGAFGIFGLTHGAFGNSQQDQGPVSERSKRKAVGFDGRSERLRAASLGHAANNEKG